MPAQKAFTLIELLVVISIIAILSAVGFVSYQGVRGKAIETRRKADLDSIKKAYESNYDPTANNGQGGYKQLTDADFSSGKIPTPDGQPLTSSNTYIIPASSPNPDNSLPNFAACAPLKEGVSCPSPNQGDCSCVTSTQGTLVDQGVISVATCDNDLSTGLIGYWDFNEGTGNTVLDKKGSGNSIWNGTLGSQWTAGKIGKAGNFDGSSNYVNIPNYSAITGLTAITGAAWINTKALSFSGNEGRIINREGNDIILQVIGGGKLFTMINGDGAGYSYTTLPVLTTDTWYHVAFTWTTVGITTIYVNGVSKPVTTVNGNGGVTGAIRQSGGGSLQFGSYAHSGSEGKFPGQIDDVRIYNRALPAPEVVKLYNGGKGCIP